MLLYEFTKFYELLFKFPPVLIWREKAINSLEKELKNLNIKPSNILDVGCGTGILISLLRKLYPQSEILGIDISAPMLNLAIKRYGKLAKFKNLDFFYFKEKQDLIIVFHSFTYFPLVPVIEKIKSLLNPGGSCVIVTNGRAPFSIIHQFIVSKLLRTKLNIYSPKDFQSLFPHTKWDLHSRIISQFEGSFILSVSNKI